MKVSGQLHTLADLPQEKEPRYPLDRRLCGPQRRSGHGGEKNFQPLPGHEPPDHPAHKHSAIPTELSPLPILNMLIVNLVISSTSFHKRCL
jgi:hypothetical protein